MSANTSMAGIIAQGSKVEKLQEVQLQGADWRRQKELTAEEEEKLRKQKQVRESPESEKSLSVTEREQQQQGKPDSEDPAAKEKESEKQKKDAPRKAEGSHIIDIVV